MTLELTVSRSAMRVGCGRGEALVAKRLAWQLDLDSSVWLANAPPEQRVRYTCGRLEGPLSEVSKPKVNACLLFRAVASKCRFPKTRGSNPYARGRTGRYLVRRVA